MKAVHILKSANTSVIELRGLKNVVTGSFENAATLGITIFDEAGVEVTGQAWPLVLAYVAASDGIYRGVLLSTVLPIAVTDYTATLTADDGNGSIGTWQIDVEVHDRKF